ncbi:MAG: phospho-N-acetylmuramoyl-pentapeptide-transferase, partial [Halothiobacillaceae bacterium]|nr:phospho-N-acetylmuramoyl-pentapeptide-transferase [Halothiobacillaceae bacterium]
MLLVLFDFLTQYYSGFGVFKYLTLRALLGVMTALLIALWVGPGMIRWLQRVKAGQPIRGDGPQSHQAKAGTPTMGGALMLVAMSVAILLWGDLSNVYVWIALLVTLAFGVVGGMDDYLKLSKRNSRGLSARAKYFWQSLIGFSAAGVLYALASTPVETSLSLPLFKDVLIPLGAGYILLAYFVIVGSS